MLIAGHGFDGAKHGTDAVCHANVAAIGVNLLLLQFGVFFGGGPQRAEGAM